MNTTIFHHDVTSVTVGESQPVGELGTECRTLTIKSADGYELKLHLFARTAEATLPAFEIDVTEAAA